MTKLTNYRIGDLGRVVELQAEYYQRHWQLGSRFEALMANDMGEFFLRFNAQTDLAIIARDGERVIGSIFVDGGKEAEHVWLRYFVLHEDYQGKGIGKQMFSDAMQFAESLGRQTIRLWTQDKLAPALSIYARFGFEEVDRVTDEYWGQSLNRMLLVKSVR